jgi:hypothetical protein
MPSEITKTMRPYGRPLPQVVEALNSYRAEIEALMAQLPPHELRRESEKGRDLVASAKKLKVTMRDDLERAEKFEREGKLSDAEQRYYLPTLQKALVSLQRLHLGSRPGPQWMDPLYDASGDIGHAVAGAEPAGK